MQSSQKRILTTHIGSLPRPRPLLDLLLRQEREETIDKREFDRHLREGADLASARLWG